LPAGAPNWAHRAELTIIAAPVNVKILFFISIVLLVLIWLALAALLLIRAPAKKVHGPLGRFANLTIFLYNGLRESSHAKLE
jgi:hypothetical protein